MSAIRSLVASTVRLFKRLRGASREEIIARCDSHKRQLEYRGMSLLKKADEFHRDAIFYAKRRMLNAARARLEAWSEYKSEAESCVIMATLYDRVRLRMLRAESLRDITKISELVAGEFEKLLGKLPDDPVSARYTLEGTIETIDGMMAHYVEAPLASELKTEVEDELKAIMAPEGRPSPAPPIEAVTVPEAGGEVPEEVGEREGEKPSTKDEEVEGELRKIRAMIGM